VGLGQKLQTKLLWLVSGRSVMKRQWGTVLGRGWGGACARVGGGGVVVVRAFTKAKVGDGGGDVGLGPKTKISAWLVRRGAMV